MTAEAATKAASQRFCRLCPGAAAGLAGAASRGRPHLRHAVRPGRILEPHEAQVTYRFTSAVPARRACER